jgi:hypothetical protein
MHCAPQPAARKPNITRFLNHPTFSHFQRTPPPPTLALNTSFCIEKTTSDQPALQQIHEATNQLWLTRKEPWEVN